MIKLDIQILTSSGSSSPNTANSFLIVLNKIILMIPRRKTSNIKELNKENQ